MLEYPIKKAARLFEMLFSDKKELLGLYNAVNQTNYTNPEDLEINTLENAIYLSMHNDISFIIDSRLSLYEHQSTYSPNLPLRFLMYVSDLYSKITKDANLYGTRIVKVPPPRFLIFYNGIENRPEREEMNLSDAFSITECIKEGILAEFLTTYRAEAKKMSIYEYDEERQRRFDWEEGKEEGYSAGWNDGKNVGKEEGRLEGKLVNLMELVDEGLLDLRVAADKATKTEKEFFEMMNEWKTKKQQV